MAETYHITFIPEPGDDRPAGVRVRQMLKDAFRRHRLRCVAVDGSVAQEPPEAGEAADGAKAAGGAAVAPLVSPEGNSETRRQRELPGRTCASSCDTREIILAGIASDLAFWGSRERFEELNGLARKTAGRDFERCQRARLACAVEYDPRQWLGYPPTAADRQRFSRELSRMEADGLVERLYGNTGTRCTHVRLLALPTDFNRGGLE